jgi:two-component system LytT family sensor kinase
MPDNMLLNVQSTIEENPRYRFWFWQIGFWFFMCVVGFFTLILWYAEASKETVGHVIMQAIIGLICSIFLHRAFNLLNKYGLLTRIFIGLVLVLSTSFLWTLLHMEVFVLLTGFDDVWDEFGGWYFSGIFVFLCWTGLFYGVRYYELQQLEHDIMLKAEATTREEHLKRVRAQSEARDAKLKMLRYQLNPHFLCNTLNAINSLIESQELHKAQNMTVQLSEFLRYSLDTDPDTKIPLSEEIDALNLYLEIEKTRFAERLNIKIDVQDEAKSALVPSLLLQPIIENSMKHAIAKNEDGGTIFIIAAVVNHELVLTLKDTGKSHPSQSKKRSDNISQEFGTGKGVGLKNIKQRLSALYNKTYCISAFFGDQGGLTTIINLPLERENKVV